MESASPFVLRVLISYSVNRVSRAHACVWLIQILRKENSLKHLFGSRVCVDIALGTIHD